MNIVPFGCKPDRKTVAVIGSGISGASAAWALSGTADVTMFEAGIQPGGHTATVDVDYDGISIPVDTGFIVYNELNYPELTALFAHLGVATHVSDMGFALSLNDGKLEWCGKNLRTIFTQKRNFFSPGFLWMLREILRFNRVCIEDRDSGWIGHSTIGDYLDRRGFSHDFRENYLVPMAAAIWSTPRAQMLNYPASAFVTFFDNHRLLHADRDRPVWRTVTGGARTYLGKLLAPLADRMHVGASVRNIVRDALGVVVASDRLPPQRFDAVVIAAHSDQALAMLGDASSVETKILSAIPYCQNRVVLHRDPRLMPRRRGAWSTTSATGPAARASTPARWPRWRLVWRCRWRGTYTANTRPSFMAGRSGFSRATSSPSFWPGRRSGSSASATWAGRCTACFNPSAAGCRCSIPGCPPAT